LLIFILSVLSIIEIGMLKFPTTIVSGHISYFTLRSIGLMNLRELKLTAYIFRIVISSSWIFFSSLMSEPAVGLCLCELASGLVRKLQGTVAKVSDQTLPV
jgi:hypothetical protein